MLTRYQQLGLYVATFLFGVAGTSFYLWLVHRFAPAPFFHGSVGATVGYLLGRIQGSRRSQARST